MRGSAHRYFGCALLLAACSGEERSDPPDVGGVEDCGRAGERDPVELPPTPQRDAGSPTLDIGGFPENDLGIDFNVNPDPAPSPECIDRCRVFDDRPCCEYPYSHHDFCFDACAAAASGYDCADEVDALLTCLVDARSGAFICRDDEEILQCGACGSEQDALRACDDWHLPCE